MKTVFVFSKDTAGGMRTYISSLAKLKNKFLFHFYFFKKDAYCKINYSKYLKKNNITYLNESYPYDSLLGFNKILLFIKNFLSSIFLINKNSADIIITLDYYSYIMIAFIKIFNLGVFNFIATHHTDVITYINNKKPVLFRFFFKKILIYLSKIPDINIFVSNGIKKRFIDTINKKIKYKVIYNGLTFSKKRQRIKSMNRKRCRLITIGRLDVQKDYNTLLRVVKKLIDEKINVFLYLIGDGPLKDQLLSQIKKLRINKNVLITGYVKNIYSYLRNSDIFLFSSFYEGFGYSIIEAMSCGLPIIATNSPSGPSEILEDGKYGILIPMKDEKKFIFNIKKLINNPRVYEKYSKLSLIRSSHFSEAKMLRSYRSALSY